MTTEQPKTENDGFVAGASLPRVSLHTLYQHMVKVVKGNCRFGLFRTFKETDWLTDTKFLIRLPEEAKTKLLAKIKDDQIEALKVAPYQDIMSQAKRLGTSSSPARLVAVRQPDDDEGVTRARVRDDAADREAILDAHILAWFWMIFPKGTLHLPADSGRMVLLKNDGEVVGVVMPLC